MLRRYIPDARYQIVYPADGAGFLSEPGAKAGAVPGVSLNSFTSLLWTGSSLNIYHGTPAVERQIELAKASFAAGVPAFGSCWAIHIAATAAGGECRLNPNGREFGISRKIALTDAGRAHPLFADKPVAFDAFTSHFDEVLRLPPDSQVLATNAATTIQAACIRANDTDFWAVQYHPEYDLREVAALSRFRRDGLLAEGRFANAADFARWTTEYESLHSAFQQQSTAPADAGASDARATISKLAWRHGIESDLSDPAIRTVELRNWLRHLGLRV